jgi:hypothetical protein
VAAVAVKEGIVGSAGCGPAMELAEVAAEVQRLTQILK